MLCHGNTHRSPLAEAVLASVVGDERVRSRGVKPNAKGPAAKKVREYAERNGWDLGQHRAGTVTADDLAWADLILYMDEGNLRRLNAMGVADDRLKCLAEYVGITKISDPAFTPRGPDLEELLDLVVSSSLACAKLVK